MGMGRWSMGIGFWTKYLIILPILLILYIPYWLIKPFSEEKADKYAWHITRKTGFIIKWIEK
jgi:hypothetical protein